MDDAQRLAIFRAQTSNVRRLEAARGQVRRTINLALRRGDVPAEEAHTLVLALLYCAWLEALFVKITHTPHGFHLSEISQIKSIQDASGIHAAWRKCIDIGLRHVPSGPKSGEIPNMRQRLNRLVAEFVYEPALIRNKIAHGQWAVALNRERTAVNQEVTSRIEDLDIVVLDRWFECAKRLAEIIEALVESPDRHFRAAYWELLTHLETDMDQMSSWTRASRIATLRRKRTPRISEAEGLPGQEAFAAADGAP